MLDSCNLGSPISSRLMAFSSTWITRITRSSALIVEWHSELDIGWLFTYLTGVIIMEMICEKLLGSLLSRNDHSMIACVDAACLTTYHHDNSEIPTSLSLIPLI